LEKFFKFIDRVNALAFFTGVVLAAGLLLWAVGNSLWEGKAKTSVIVPNATAEKSEVLSLTAWEFIPESSIQVLKLQSIGGESNDYASEGRNYETRNLLFVKSDGGASTWLFPDQSHLISRIERITAPDGRTKAIFFGSRLAAGVKNGQQFSLYLTKPDGTSPVEVLKDIDHVVSRRISGNIIHLIYQSELEIKESKISMTSLNAESDLVVAKLRTVK
jgi:hypothetical protein